MNRKPPHGAEFGPGGESRWLVVEWRLRVEVCEESSSLRYVEISILG